MLWLGKLRRRSKRQIDLFSLVYKLRNIGKQINAINKSLSTKHCPCVLWQPEIATGKQFENIDKIKLNLVHFEPEPETEAGRGRGRGRDRSDFVLLVVAVGQKAKRSHLHFEAIYCSN